MEGSENQYEVLNEKGKYKELFDFSEQNLESGLEAKYWNLHALWRMGEIDKALKRAKGYEVEFNHDKDWNGKFLNRYAGIYWEMGDYDLALKYLQESLIMAEEIEDYLQISTCLNNISVIYNNKGDHDQSLEFLQKSLDLHLSKHVENKAALGLIFLNIGLTYQNKNDFDQALKYYQKGLLLDEEIGNPQQRGLLLLHITNCYLERGSEDDRSRAKIYLDLLKQLEQHNEDKVIELYYYSSLAHYLKSSTRSRDKAEAEQLFRKIIDGENVRFVMKISAIYHLIELMIFEYKTYKETEVLEEVYSYLGKVYEIAQEKHLFPNLVSSLILRSKLMIVEGELDSGLKFLKQAILTAEEKGLTYWLEKVLDEKTKITEEYQEMKRMIESNVSLSERMDKMAVLDYLKIAQKMTH